MSTRDIQSHIREPYGIEISPDLVSAVTDSVIDEVSAWQARPLESSYAIVFFDALRLKIRDEGLVKNKAVYLAIGMRPSGHKQVLGLWIEQSEGAKFWLRVMKRDQGPRHPGHPDRSRRWLEGISRGHHRPFSPTPWFRRASFISSATRCSLPPGRSASSSPAP